MKTEINTDEVIASIEASTLKGRKTDSIQVRYDAEYAVYVHENLQVYHQNGEAKFLENAIKKVSQEMRDAIEKTMKNKKSLKIALLRAGKILLTESNKRVPVDTGFLRNSGIIAEE